MIPNLTPQEIPWLKEILTSYPGSKYGNTETRGLDSNFAEQTYVETQLEKALLTEIEHRQVSLVILCGNAGDGKTAFLQHLVTKLGSKKPSSAQRIWNTTLPTGLKLLINLDGSASFQGKTANELLDQIFEPFHLNQPPPNLIHLVAINSGKLLEWIENYQTRHGATLLTKQLWDALAGKEKQVAPHIRFIDLNVRSLVGGVNPETKTFSTDFLDQLINKLLAHPDWKKCPTCSANNRCTAWKSVNLLTSKQGLIIKQRLYKALQAVHQRGEIHITAREIRSAISYIFFGIDYCTDLHEDPGYQPNHYYDRTFDPDTEQRQGELLTELTYLDPALENHPLIDLQLIKDQKISDRPTLASAKRQGYFEIEQITDQKTEYLLTKGQYLETFMKVAIMEESDKQKICQDICKGISKLEDLPNIVLNKTQGVPLRITPRTLTESVFWIEKESDRFHLTTEELINVEGLETLHRHLILEYHYHDGRTEKLIIGVELFHNLMELKEGYQFSDISSDEKFAYLSIFTQRLAQENDQIIYAWNPLEEDSIFQIGIEHQNHLQQLVLTRK